MPESGAVPNLPLRTARIRTLLACLLLLGLTAAVFGSVRGHEFVTWDDDDYVVENPRVAAGLSWEGVAWAFTTGHTGNWHPLTWLSHMLDVELFGMDAGMHHVVNALLHAANTLLLFGALRRMTGEIGKSAFVAALFAIHPMHVESVAWVAERKDVLSTSFFMLSLHAYAAWVRDSRAPRHALLVASFAAGLMAKPMLVTLPFLLLILDRWPLARRRTRSAWELVREKLPLFALAIASCVVTAVVQSRGGTIVPRPLDDRVANALVSYVMYVANTLVPSRLAAMYPYESRPQLSAEMAALALAAVTVAVILQARRRPYLAAGWLWFLGTLVPVIGLVAVGSQSMADRYGYVPLVGLFVMAAWGVPDLLASWRFGRAASATAAVVVVAACAIAARAQVGVWRNTFTLWERTLEVTTDNSVAHVNLGYAHLRAGSNEDAARHFLAAIRIHPDNPIAHNNLGLAVGRLGRLAEAGSAFEEAIRIRPDYAEAHNNLAVVLSETGRLDRAIEVQSAAVRLEPDNADWRKNLDLYLSRRAAAEPPR